MAKVCFILLLLSISSSDCLGQNKSETANVVTNNSYLDVHWANDITNQTDYYYTNGFELNFYGRNLVNSPFEKVMVGQKEFPVKNSGISFKHHIFTPRNISVTTNSNDRPFTSYWLLSYNSMVKDPLGKVLIRSEISIGLMGKYAFGKQVQNGFHSLLAHSHEIPGWDNQLKESPLFSYQLNFEKGLHQGEYLQVNGISAIRLGLPYTDFMVGGKIQLGLFDSYFEFHNRSYVRKFQVFMYAVPTMKVVAYNATLQGGFNRAKSQYSIPDVKNLIPQLAAGFQIRINNYSLAIDQTFIGSEFQSGIAHGWGSIKIGVSF